jgi:hypothetical protein
MQHLSLEDLARLLDEPLAADEAAHLEACALCRAELDGLRRQAEALHRLGPIEPPEGAWNELEQRLVRAALITPLGSVRGLAGRSPWNGRLLRIAAAVVLYAAGAGTALALHLSPRATSAPGGNVATTSNGLATSSPATSEPAQTIAPPTGTVAAAPEEGSETAAPTGHRLVAAPDEQAAPATPEEALAAVHAAERSYLQAYARYAELTDAQQAEDPVTRVAALESIVLTTREALDRAPADPVINGYHLTAVAQRDAALRQIALRSNGPWF